MEALFSRARAFLVAWVYTFVFYVDCDSATPKLQLALEAALASLIIVIAIQFTAHDDDSESGHHHHGHHH
jgi:hypothetical protein